MPWLYNPDRSQVQITKADGQAAAIPGRTKVYIEPSNMSADIGAKLASRALLNKGGDPVSVAAEEALDKQDDVGISSDIHGDTDIVLPDLVSLPKLTEHYTSDDSPIADDLVEEDDATGDISDDSGVENTNSGKRRKRRRR